MPATTGYAQHPQPGTPVCNRPRIICWAGLCSTFNPPAQKGQRNSFSEASSISLFSQPGTFHQAPHHFIRGEIFRGDFMRGAAMAGVIGFDGIHRREDVFHGFEPKQPASAWQELAESRLLSDHRPARGEITRRSVTEPAGIWPDILIARHGEFAAGLLDVAPVEPGIA